MSEAFPDKRADPLPVALAVGAVVAWSAAVLAVTIGASEIATDQLHAWQASLRDARLSGIEASVLHDRTVFTFLLILGLWPVARAVRNPRDRLPVAGAALLVYGAALLFVGQARYAVTGTELIVQPLPPWRSPVRVPIAATRVVETACLRGYRRSNQAVFRVRYGDDATVDLGSSLGWRSNRRWLDAVQPFAGATGPRFPGSGEATGPIRAACPR